MERRTILTALAAAPLAALASTAHALGRRKRQCCEQPSFSGEEPKGLDPPTLTITPLPGMPGMTFSKVSINVNVTAEFIAGVVEEDVMMVEGRLLDPTGSPVSGYDFTPMSRPLTPPPPPHGAGIYQCEKNVMLSPTKQYRAQVRVVITKKEFGLSGPQTAN